MPYDSIMKIYFDATDIAHWAGHSDRVTGIQRVELNIVRSLARDHGGVIRGIFFDRDSRAFYEFDPACLAHAGEFSAEGLLIDLGLQQAAVDALLSIDREPHCVALALGKALPVEQPRRPKLPWSGEPRRFRQASGDRCLEQAGHRRSSLKQADDYIRRSQGQTSA